MQSASFGFVGDEVLIVLRVDYIIWELVFVSWKLLL